MMENQNFNIEEGTISFWVKENTIDWSGKDAAPLFELSKNGNSIFVVKDSDGYLKFFHVYLGKGRTDVAADIHSLSLPNDVRHFVAVTWSVPRKEIVLYLDGKEIKKSVIQY